jgi:NADH:ubiquinone oxidoreductase subunit 5 (subunit L)/multisubunit Na+/H+ antiporter MnhA subunit
MWNKLWQKWTIDKPAALGDWLWDVFVVQLAALLDKLTLRRIIALIPVVVLILAYAHRIPLPPELMLVGDFFAYIDVFSALILLGVLSRAATILFIVKEAAGLAVRLATGLLERMQRMDFRHRREGGVRNRNPFTRRAADDDDPGFYGVAWA